MKNIYKFPLALIASATLMASLQAKSCVNAKDIDVKWTSFKTLSKVGVNGNFNDVKLSIKNKNAKDIKSLLENSVVDILLSSIDAKNALKNANIKKYFVKNLSSKTINAKIVEAYDKDLRVMIKLNGVSKIIPMTYGVKDGVVVAKGVIDGVDFKLKKALKILNTNVSEHLNKGWYDIPIKFNMTISENCIK